MIYPYNLIKSSSFKSSSFKSSSFKSSSSSFKLPTKSLPFARYMLQITPSLTLSTFMLQRFHSLPASMRFTPISTSFKNAYNMVISSYCNGSTDGSSDDDEILQVQGQTPKQTLLHQIDKEVLNEAISNLSKRTQRTSKRLFFIIFTRKKFAYSASKITPKQL